MTQIILRLYDYLHAHRVLMLVWLAVLTVLSVILVLRISYKEDISDFLPFDKRGQEAMRVYQGISGSDNIVALIGAKNGSSATPDSIVEATEEFYGKLKEAGIDEKSITAQMDLEKFYTLADFIYTNIPYFLTDEDYRRMEAQLARKDFITSQLQRDKQTLLLPSGGLLSENIGRDPLNWFTPVVEKLSPQSANTSYELYSGSIFMPDMRRAVVLIASPYGSSETENNEQLISKIETAKEQTERIHPNMAIELTGGPVIAVDNASQIKTDSIVSVAIAVTLILLLLILTFRNARNILLIGLSISWGWLVALGALSVVNNNISIIVVGISSVIIGIAINYPLHLIAHLTHTPNTRQAIKEIITPLIVGNITTIGAFLTLVPLQSIALRDLGLFASFLLLGTILFVIVFLPHLVRHTNPRPNPLLNKIGNARIENKKWIIGAVAVLTIVFAAYSSRAGFDTNLSHINYMTDTQRQNMDYLAQQLQSARGQKEVYVVSSGQTMEDALAAHERILPRLNTLQQPQTVSGTGTFLCSKAEQEKRLSRWNAFISKHGQQLTASLTEEADREGFAQGSFEEFIRILNGNYPTRPASYFKPLQEGAFKNRIYFDKASGTHNIIDVLTVSETQLPQTLAAVKQSISDDCHFMFEIGQLNSSIATHLSDNFNYIGYACGLIVFLFLWFSMGNIELATLSFLPMAVSWVWILGIMGILHVDFNIVNIILATFIFGQGDDYTIFMTEGCQHEYAYGRKMLASYKHSILLSALIMFIGMGALIVARHPALHSLAVITIIGMFSVVLMAWLLPPFVFNWLVSKNGKLRLRPITLHSLLMPRQHPQLCGAESSPEERIRYVRDVYHYCGIDIVRQVKAALRHHGDFIMPATDDHTITVKGGNYGAVALLLAIAHPQATIIAHTNDDDDLAVCRQMACRIAPNIQPVQTQSNAATDKPHTNESHKGNNGNQESQLYPPRHNIS